MIHGQITMNNGSFITITIKFRRQIYRSLSFVLIIVCPERSSLTYQEETKLRVLQ